MGAEEEEEEEEEEGGGDCATALLRPLAGCPTAVASITHLCCTGLVLHVPLEVLSPFSALQQLDLEHARPGGPLDPAWQLTQLRRLALGSSNQRDQSDWAGLSRLRQLSELSLERCAGVNAAAALLPGMTSLQDLTATHRSFGYLTAEWRNMASLPGLRSLRLGCLASMRLLAAALPALASRIQCLDLMLASLDGAAQLASCTALTRLRLEHEPADCLQARLAAASVRALASLPQLRHLEFERLQLEDLALLGPLAAALTLLVLCESSDGGLWAALPALLACGPCQWRGQAPLARASPCRQAWPRCASSLTCASLQWSPQAAGSTCPRSSASSSCTLSPASSPLCRQTSAP